MVQPLDRVLRRRLDETVCEAREVAEAGARASLEALGVGESAPFAHLSEEQRETRRGLRAHGRQLGDRLNGAGAQSMDRLVEEVAYEHWHRMLFARFLAENSLLMVPDPDQPVPVTLEECEDLAAEQGAADGWEVASRFAASMLPQIFRADSPVFRLALPPEHRQDLERLLSGLAPETFAASDALGWVYQYWQAKRKDEINASEVKIGARELPAVTQLFTEPYMVSFLLDNSLGAWWAARKLSEVDMRDAESEETLRARAALPGVPLSYLRFVRDGEGAWQPAAGEFQGWPQRLSELKALDPCCGSGHFLVAAFLMLVPMRAELEGLSAREAADRVLSENLHGLDIDRRVTEIAAFALALEAWKYPEAGGYRPLPQLNVACSGLSVGAGAEEWKRLASGKRNLGIALEWMHEAFRHAPVLGSLIDPSQTDAARLVPWDELSEAVDRAMRAEAGDEVQEVAVAAQGLAKAADLLGRRYHWVITNVPYLARGKQAERLREFCEKQYPAGRNDLATAFLERCLDACLQEGTTSIVLPQNWLFLTSYRKLREKLLKRDTWHFLARLGSGAFETISGEVVKAVLLTLSRGPSSASRIDLLAEDGALNSIHGLDVSDLRTAAEKAAALLTGEIAAVDQAQQLENPDARVALEEASPSGLLDEYATNHQGLSTGDNPRFRRSFWEVGDLGVAWVPEQSTVDATTSFGGRAGILLWEQGVGQLRAFGKENVSALHNVDRRGEGAWDRRGIGISQMRSLPATLYGGQKFDTNVAVVLPKNPAHLPAIWCFCSSPEYSQAVREIDQSLKVTNATLVKVPFDLDYWTRVAQEKYPDGLPEPYSDDPTQWIFHGHPARSENPLQVAVARLLGYRWPAELDPGMELSAEARAWVKRSEALLPLADTDGIVCIPPVRGEASGSERLLKLLAVAYGQAQGSEWSADTLAELLALADYRGKSLESWLRDGFFTQHCKLFHHRPFIWHIWDGLRDGFAALVNYHKLDRRLLETLIYTYVGDWINRQKQDIGAGVDGAEERLAAAEALGKALELILRGEAPYDVFVRWKPIEEQPIGWDPDPDDGVRLNLRPFMTAEDVGKKGAGVLRDRPNVNWGKDRGKDVKSAPWYPLFGGDRINDHHLSLAEKQAAVEKAPRGKAGR